MMSTTVQKPATTPIPVLLSAPEFEAFNLRTRIKRLVHRTFAFRRRNRGTIW
jgi:hypothetical protein